MSPVDPPTMKKTRPPPPDLRELRIRAALLLKALDGDDAGIARAAAERFRALPAFSSLRVPEVLAQRDAVQRKHALAVIAHEQGHASWAALKAALAAKEIEQAPEVLFHRSGGAFLNAWFRTHAEAVAAREASGGFLFPYRDQFVVCDRTLLRAHGLDPAGPDWVRLGFDWARPKDLEARERLASVLHALAGRASPEGRR